MTPKQWQKLRLLDRVIGKCDRQLSVSRHFYYHPETAKIERYRKACDMERKELRRELKEKI